jgi:hypothetical protein
VPALARSLEGGELPLLLERVAENAGGALLFIDQFEEIFALCNDDVTRSRFLDSLVRAALQRPHRSNSRLKIVCAVRSDWAHRVFSYRGFTDLIQNADVKIGPLTEDEIRQAMEQPAALCGVRFEPGLVQRVVVDAGAEPGTLPLLEFALARLWERQTGGLLTHAAYDEIGRLSGAIANRAEAVFRGLSSTQQEVTRGILTSLVHLAEDSDAHTRRRLPVAELYAQDRLNTDEGRHVLHVLIEARLLTSGLQQDLRQETVELAHEAVIRRWPRFRQWLREDGDLLAWRERLRIILEQWQNSGRDEGFLLRGPLLDEATLWLARQGTHLNLAERQLIQASYARRQHDRWNRPVRSLDVLIDASPREVHGALGQSLQRQDAGTGRLWRLQVQLFAVPAVQERELSLRLPHVPANQALPLLAAKPSAAFEIDEASEYLEDAAGAGNIGVEALSFLEDMQRRGGSGPALEFLAPQLDSIHDTAMRLKFASILFDMMHLRGRYEDAATLIEQELAFHTRSDPQLAPLLLSLRIRLLHHQMFYRRVDDVWSSMLELLPQCDPGSPCYGEILFMLGGNLGALRGDYREARRFLVRASGTHSVVATSTCYQDVFASMEITFVVGATSSSRLRCCAKPGAWPNVAVERARESMSQAAWAILNGSVETSGRRGISLSRRWRGRKRHTYPAGLDTPISGWLNWRPPRTRSSRRRRSSDRPSRSTGTRVRAISGERFKSASFAEDFCGQRAGTSGGMYWKRRIAKLRPWVTSAMRHCYAEPWTTAATCPTL